MKTLRCVISLVLVTIALAGIEARASVSYSVAGSTYSQNFDSLPNTPENVSLGASTAGWTDDNASPAAGNFSILGWYLYHPLVPTGGETGFNTHQRFPNGRSE